MKRMGISQQEIDAVQVIIRCKDKNIIIDQPEVSKMNMMGQMMFQVAGESREEDISQKIEISEDDVQTVMDQTGASETDAREAIEKANGDLAQAILALTGEE